MSELFIESIGDAGDGVASLHGARIYAPLALPGERVMAQVLGGRALRIEVLAASLDRVEAPCPHFGACGGCALQHWRDEAALAWKREVIVRALSRVGIKTEVLATVAIGPRTRRRLSLHARREGGSVVLGFKARRSHRLAPISTCLLAHPRLEAALADLRSLAEPFFEHPASAPTLHATWTLTGLDVDVSGVFARNGGLSADASARAASLAESADLARLSVAGDPIYCARPAVIAFGRACVSLPPGAFLQASFEAEEAMAAFALAHSDGASRIADLFSGSGAFALRLAERARVSAVDASPSALAALADAARSTDRLCAVETEVRDLFRRPLTPRELQSFDLVIFDPPRAGAAAQAEALAAADVEQVIAVSCNPATFARDARLLVEGGYHLQKIIPVDQFQWSPHVELIAAFKRRGRTK
ncbi:MAG: class I SAM-dependent RNA methyltransferase [Caulobacteraceae bacterium]